MSRFVLFLLAIATLVRLRCCLPALAPMWTLPLFVSLAAVISWGSWRFRQPGDLGLILLAAALPYAARIRIRIGGWMPWETFCLCYPRQTLHA